jgi:hypothetical protein
VSDEISLPSDLAEAFKRFFNTFKIFTALSKAWNTELVTRGLISIPGCKPALVYEIVMASSPVGYRLEFRCDDCRVVLPLPAFPYSSRNKVEKLMRRLNMPLTAVKAVSELPFVWVDIYYLLDFYLTERWKMNFGDSTLSLRNLTIDSPDEVRITLMLDGANYSSSFSFIDGKLVYRQSPMLGVSETMTNVVRRLLEEEKNSFMKFLDCATNILTSINNYLSIYILY